MTVDNRYVTIVNTLWSIILYEVQELASVYPMQNVLLPRSLTS